MGIEQRHRQKRGRADAILRKTSRGLADVDCRPVKVPQSMRFGLNQSQIWKDGGRECCVKLEVENVIDYENLTDVSRITTRPTSSVSRTRICMFYLITVHDFPLV